jgi:hypothetical protein
MNMLTMEYILNEFVFIGKCIDLLDCVMNTNVRSPPLNKNKKEAGVTRTSHCLHNVTMR